jgi:hypothetical protein
MGRTRSAVVATALGALISAGASPAAAAEGDPLVVTSTGLIEGQDISTRSVFRPVWTGGATVTKVEIYLNGQPRGTVLNGNWSNGIHTYVSAADDNTDATLTVKVYDTAGNVADASTGVHLDTTPPTATLDPAPGTPLRGVITVAATEVSADVAEIALINVSNTKLATVTTAPWIITWNSVGGSGARIAITDRAGNRRVYPGWAFDNTSPSIADLYDYDGAPIRRVRGITPMQVGFSDSLGVIRYEWWVDGELVQSHSQNSGSSSSVAVLTYDFGTTARTASVEVRAWDLAGNPAARTYELIVDVAGPTVTSVTPANGTFVRGSGITSTVRATDPAGIIGASLDASWVTDPKNLTIAVSAGADGRKTLTWRVHDKVHNVTTVGCTVIVDNTRPVLKVTKAPKSGAKVSGTVKVTASATDRNGVSKVELLINGKVVARDVKAGYGFAIKTKKYGKKIRFQLRAYDRAGNVITTTTRTWHR